LTKLNLVISDLDESYARGLLEYISSYHSAAFTVSCFTKLESFTKYLELRPAVDAMLISPEFYGLSNEFPNIKLKVVLSPGVLNREYPGFQVLNKYCTGEKLLGDILHLYSKLNPNEQRVSACLKCTSLIGIYSPAGGTGKTTIASALAMKCNEIGLNSFYLNLESIQSTGVFFNSKAKRNLSYVFLYLKEKCKNLSFKMEGIKDCDNGSGVHYFNPPESPLEYEELNSDELEQLLQGIKEMGCYNYVFIDMSSSFDRKNYRIIDMCDRIVLVCLLESIAIHKNNILYNELVKLSNSEKDSITEKIVTVINRYKDINRENTESFTGWTHNAIRIPEFSRSLINGDGRLVIDDEGFRSAISRLMEVISGK
jgi:cellulose biosynthesis protein BcsQ